MKVLMASTPATGHLNPVLGVARDLLGDGHEVTVLSGSALRSVTQALSYGLPIVGAGTTQDKADVNARVAWTGAGIDLGTNQPTPQALRQAVRTVLDQPSYRSRAKALADEFAKHDTRSEVLRIVNSLVRGTTAESMQAPLAAE
jgi:UDP:flavonoid glycosyltransferase YjiC (YdhE family)